MIQRVCDKCNQRIPGEPVGEVAVPSEIIICDACPDEELDLCDLCFVRELHQSVKRLAERMCLSWNDVIEEEA